MHQILALSGGGAKGLYALHLLAKIEEETGRPVADAFQTICGTSVGGLIAAGLAAGKTAEELIDQFQTHLPKIFKKKWFFHGLRNLIFSSAYSNDGLRNAIQATIGVDEAKSDFRDLRKTALLVSVDATNKVPLFLGSGDLRNLSPYSISIEEAILATSAAPTYFKPFQKEGVSFVDGGLIANAPEVVTLLLLQSSLGISMRDVRCLSIGASAMNRAAAPSVKQPKSKLGWVMSRQNGILDLIFAAHENFSVDIMEKVMGDRYTRINFEPSVNEYPLVRHLDFSRKKSRDAVENMAGRKWLELRDNGLFWSFFDQAN